jgi:hypothetical protein
MAKIIAIAKALADQKATLTRDAEQDWSEDAGKQ